MMKFLLFLIIAMSFTNRVNGFQVGHTTITFNDPNRTGGVGSGGGAGRQIQTEIYYPSDALGEDVPVSSGKYPVIVFGHGFAMAWDAYENIWSNLVPTGFIIAFPRTEESLFPSPSHEDFGLDLATVVTALKNEGLQNGSMFYNHISNKSAIMGHSMGGGATILAAQNNPDISAIIALAPAETNPSSISAASNVSVPALIFSASEDMVTPAIDHHIPIYNNLSSTCKYFISIIGGAHCYYANSNFNCDFGETTSGGNITITRADQQTIMFHYISAWLELYLFDDCSQQNIFMSSIGSDDEITYQSSCANYPTPQFDLTINENNGELISNSLSGPYQWFDCINNMEISGETNQNFQPISNGSYAVILGENNCLDTTSCLIFELNGTKELTPIKKKIIKVTDLLGRNSALKTNTLLLIYYSDGTVEKTIIQE